MSQARSSSGRWVHLAGVLLTVLTTIPASTLAASPGNAADAGLLLRTRIAQGRLSGTPVQAGAVAAYLGLPYAAPPVGMNRWRAPGPPAHWHGARAARQFEPSCMQQVAPQGFGPWTSEYVVRGPVSEDCLYLNIWTPAHSRHQRLPVLFWIHGGGFTGGAGSVPIYDGAALAAQGLVVVDINYRLGVFGFFALPELTAQSPEHTSGNYGLLDTLAALRWVHANITAFGGNPGAVTLAGQSAGAAIVVDLDASPLARGLYARAIAESGVGLMGSMNTLAQAEQAGTQIEQAVGAHSVSALRSLSGARLMQRVAAAAAPPGAFAPIVDGQLVPDQPARLLAEGRFNDTPFLTGMVADENSAMTAHYGTMTAQQCSATLQRLFGSDASVFESLYPSAGADCNAPVEQVMRDRGVASMYYWVQSRSVHAHSPIYLYLYDHAEPGPKAAQYGAFHSSEIPYVFRTLERSPSRDFSDEDRAISATVSSYWANYVRTGNPNGASLPNWPAFAADTDSIMELGNAFGPRPPMPPAKLQAMHDYLSSGGHLGLF